MEFTKRHLMVNDSKSCDGLEDDDTIFGEKFPEIVSQQITEVFILIIQLLFIPPSSQEELQAIVENANSYLVILRDIVTNLPGYKKMQFGHELLADFQRAQNFIDAKNDDELAKNLILCKRAIFE